MSDVPEPGQSDGVLTPRHRELFAELDVCQKGASQAIAADDWDTWASHAGRGAEIFEELAVLNGWRDQPAQRRPEG